MIVAFKILGELNRLGNVDFSIVKHYIWLLNRNLIAISTNWQIPRCNNVKNYAKDESPGDNNTKEKSLA